MVLDAADVDGYFGPSNGDLGKLSLPLPRGIGSRILSLGYCGRV